MMWPWRSVSMRPSTLASSRSADSSAQRRKLNAVCASRNRRATVGRVRSVQPAAIRDDGQVTKRYPQVGVVEDQDAWEFADCRGEVGLRAWETLENRP
jgi:hypothetical protein